MSVSKFKIWDFSLREFAKDPSLYVTYSSYFSPSDNSIHGFPVLIVGTNATILLFTGRVDSYGVDMFDGDRIRFYCISKEQYLQETIYSHSGLMWCLGDGIHFDDAINLQVIGHRFDGKEDSDQFKLYHDI